MQIFITGGAGYIGRAVSRTLVSAGHSVVGLARSASQLALLRSIGVRAIDGDLGRPEPYRSTAASADAIVHLAAPPGESGRTAVDALLDAARSGRAHAFIYTSVLFVLGETRDGADERTIAANDAYADRAQLERKVLSAAGGRLAPVVIRPGMVYGGGEGGTVSEMFRSATEGVVTYVGSGENRWPLVHRDDVASLFQLVLETNASGIFHATDGLPLRVKEVAELAAATTGATVESVAREEARDTLGRFADALCLDQPVDSTRSRALGWSPAWTSFDRSVEAAFAEFVAESATARDR